MKLYLIQHGLAQPKERDPQRPLSPEGEAQTEKIAVFLKRIDVKVDTLWHSPKHRAVQTARIIDNEINCGHILERDDLNPLDSVSEMPELIRQEEKDLIVVGHLPFLDKLVSLLLTGSEENQPVQFSNSGVVCLEYEETWRLVWAVTPDLV